MKKKLKENKNRSGLGLEFFEYCFLLLFGCWDNSNPLVYRVINIYIYIDINIVK